MDTKRTAIGGPVPSPNENVAPLAVVTCRLPRVTCANVKRKSQSITQRSGRAGRTRIPLCYADHDPTMASLPQQRVSGPRNHLILTTISQFRNQGYLRSAILILAERATLRGVRQIESGAIWQYAGGRESDSSAVWERSRTLYRGCGRPVRVCRTSGAGKTAVTSWPISAWRRFRRFSCRARRSWLINGTWQTGMAMVARTARRCLG